MYELSESRDNDGRLPPLQYMQMSLVEIFIYYTYLSMILEERLNNINNDLP